LAAVTDGVGNPTAAETVRGYVYGNVAMDDWVPRDANRAVAPWDAFDRARVLAHEGQTNGAVEIWRTIAFSEDFESRQILQAWHFLRAVGVQPPSDRAKDVLGLIAEMPVPQGHDLLAAYRDGSVRYLNHSGTVAVVEDRSSVEIQAAVRRWIAVGHMVVHTIGPWTEPTFPPLARGHARIVILTPSGPHFGQGPVERLTADQTAGPFVGVATSLMQLVVNEVLS
jgi:hypothetical protein